MAVRRNDTDLFLLLRRSTKLQELPDNPNWLLKQAVHAFYKEHYRLARWLCWVELLLNPNDYFVLCLYANSLYYLGGRHNDYKATSIYERAIKINPTNPLAHAGLGRVHYSNVLRITREYSLFPGGAEMMFMDESAPEKLSIVKGFADYECGNRKVAIKELERAAQLASDVDDKVELLLMAAEIYCIISNRDAIKAYKKVLDIDPNCISAHLDLAGCYAAIHKRKLALQEYEFIKENAPEAVTHLESVLASFNIKVNR